MKGICLRCGKDYKMLDNHLQNKNVCKVKYMDISRDLMLIDYKDKLVEFLSIKKERSKKRWICEYCDKEYSYRTGLSRHKKIHINSSKTINITNNIINNITNINNNTINNHIHIHINNFGEEKEIDYDKIIELFNGNVNNLIPSYVKEKHIEMEENRNILIPNHKDALIKILTNDGWVLAHKTSILKEILRMAIKNLIKQISKAGNIYHQKYKGDEPIERTGPYKRIVQIKDNLFNIEENMNSKNACKDEEMKVLCELVNGHEKVIETMKIIEEHINY